MAALKSNQQDQTYNIHHRQDVVLDVFASVVPDHHFVGDHERFHKALAADRAPPPAAAVLWLGGRAERRRSAELAR